MKARVNELANELAVCIGKLNNKNRELSENESKRGELQKQNEETTALLAEQKGDK